MTNELKDLVRKLSLKYAHLGTIDAELGSSQADIVEGNTANVITLACNALLKELKLHQTCAHCGEAMYTTVRAHHHTENGVDVTS